jgi:hypothetical protein
MVFFLFMSEVVAIEEVPVHEPEKLAPLLLKFIPWLKLYKDVEFEPAHILI